MLRNFLYLLIAVFGLSCHENELTYHSEIDSDTQVIHSYISKINNNSDIDTLINLGLYNLAYEAVNQNERYFKAQDKIAIARSFLENGEFDKSLSIVNQLKNNQSSFDVLHLNLLSSLNKQDNIGSKQLLDNMIKLYIGTKNHTKSIELKLLQAFYEHNNKNYTLAIKLNEEALGAILGLWLRYV